MFKNLNVKNIERINSHIDELIENINPVCIGEEYINVIQSGNKDDALKILANYFRNRTYPELSNLKEFVFKQQDADDGVIGKIRVVNIEHCFEEGKIDYYFNPTIDTPPVNHEWLWQLNRHEWWMRMACSYSKNHDEKYVIALNNQLIDWVDQTYASEEGYNTVGSAWRTIECGIRLMIVWPYTFMSCVKSINLTDEAILLMISSMYRQAKFLLKNHTEYGNWLMMESNGMFTFSSIFYEFKDSKEIARFSSGYICKEISKQVLPDGFHFELSPDYHFVSFRCASSVYRVAMECKNESAINDEFRELIKKMAMNAVFLSTPGFTQPRTNDCYTIHTKMLTGISAQIFPNQSEFEFINSNRKSGKAPEGETSSCFMPWSGFAVMRSDWGEDASYLCFDVGPLGGGHIHQDKLNINIFKGKEELVFDDGGGQYESSPARYYGCSSLDHNTIAIDGMGQNRTTPKVVTEPIDVNWISNDTFDYAIASYDDDFGIEKKKLVKHTREVRFCKPEFFIVKDTVKSIDGNKHNVEMRLHLDTLNVSKLENSKEFYVADYDKEWNLLIVPINMDDKEVIKTVSGQTEPCYLGWYIGRNEERNHEATTYIREIDDCKECNYVTALIPFKRGGELPTVIIDNNTVNVSIGGKEYSVDIGELNK